MDAWQWKTAAGMLAVRLATFSPLQARRMAIRLRREGLDEVADMLEHDARWWESLNHAQDAWDQMRSNDIGRAA